MAEDKSHSRADRKSPLREITQPFVDLVHAPRSLWGVNLGYLIEGMVYFGMINYLAMYFNEYVGLNDIWAGWSVTILAAGITISMFFFGGLADKWGVRRALIVAFGLMIVGRCVISGAPMLDGEQGGPLSTIHLLALFGVLVIVLGYGMYEPAAYSAVRQFTSPKTAAMGYAMLYALMNLGAWLPTFFSPVRQAIGISGVYWILTGFTVVALLCTVILLSRRTVRDAIEKANRERELAERDSREASGSADPNAAGTDAETAEGGGSAGFVAWLKRHPMADLRFTFFIFALLPVQTLFAHNWLTLPMYVQRAYRDSWPWISANFEPAVSFNPLLIFILVPIVAAMTTKASVYKLMIVGTFIMAAPTFLLALGPTAPTLIGYLVIMTVGEAIWQPRFLQFAAEIAPPGRTGAYIGVARLPWFLTKIIVPLYSGFFLERYCPQEGAIHSESMWLIYGFIAMSSTVLLVVAKPWATKGLKTSAIESS